MPVNGLACKHRIGKLRLPNLANSSQRRVGAATTDHAEHPVNIAVRPLAGAQSAPPADYITDPTVT
jgi:hypothetical protein